MELPTLRTNHTLQRKLVQERNPMTTNKLDEIAEGYYRWIIDAVNHAIEASNQKGEQVQPIVGTGNAPLLSPDEFKAALQAAYISREEVERTRIDNIYNGALFTSYQIILYDGSKEVLRSPIYDKSVQLMAKTQQKEESRGA
jgi:hypothetical protein